MSLSSSYFSEGGTIEKLVIYLLLLSSKSSGMPVISKSSGMSMI